MKLPNNPTWTKTEDEQEKLLDQAHKEIADLRARIEFFKKEVDRYRLKHQEELSIRVWLMRHGYNDIVQAAKVAIRMEKPDEN